jgi:hypothetical protein
LQHFIRMLKAGGRGGMVIKNTFLSNGDNGSVSLRKLLLESCNLHTVLDCPQGTFQGSGVKTVVLFFEKGAPTRKIWYYRLNPGRNLGKTAPLNDDDLAEFVKLQRTFAASPTSWSVDAKNIDRAMCDLSVKNPNGRAAVAHSSPEAILEDIATLVNESSEILANVRALLGSYRPTTFVNENKAWVQKPLTGVVDSTCSLSYGIVQPGEEFPSGLPVVRPTDLTKKIVGSDGLKRIDPSLAEAYRRTELKGGELLLCVRGTTGAISIASDELAGANVTRGIVPIRFNKSLVLQEFGYHLMRSSDVQRQIQEKTYGAALMQINIRDLRNITLSFPSLREQQQIVDTLDALSEEIESLARGYQRKLVALDDLKESMLHNTFAG